MTGQGSSNRKRLTAARSARPLAGAVLGAATLLVACNAILGIEEAELIEAAGGAGGTGTGGTPCQNASTCDDDNPCTTDDCNTAVGRCSNEPVPDGPAPPELQTDGDCRQVECLQGEVQSEADDADIPVDDIECTEDRCIAGEPLNPTVVDGTACSQNGGKVCYGGNCVDCYDNSHCTPPETCGGGTEPLECGCTPTACSGITCGWKEDSLCHDPPQYVNCDNQQQDGDETDVDCGGNVTSCDTRCENGQSCEQPSDCTSGICNCDTCGHTGGCGGAGA